MADFVQKFLFPQIWGFSPKKLFFLSRPYAFAELIAYVYVVELIMLGWLDGWMDGINVDEYKIITPTQTPTHTHTHTHTSVARFCERNKQPGL